ncbi:hypothetical protein GCM10010493_64040 [Streptomyces lavendulae subsp. grasserius]
MRKNAAIVTGVPRAGEVEQRRRCRRVDAVLLVLARSRTPERPVRALAVYVDAVRQSVLERGGLCHLLVVVRRGVLQEQSAAAPGAGPG